MSQYPSPSQDPFSPYEAPAQQPGTPRPAEPRSVPVSLPTSTPYITYGIAAITALVYLIQLATTNWQGTQFDLPEFYGARINELIRAGQLWRFLTPVLLHASIPHIGFNMYALIIFGPGLERNFGHWRFLALYLLGGFAGNVLSFLLSSGYSVGASTAIFGMIGAEGVFLYQNRRLFGNRFRSAIGNIIFIVVVNLVLGLTPGIDNWGHVGGLLGGLIFAWFAGPKWEVEGMMPALHVVDKREARDVITGAAIVLLIFGALAVWGMTAPIVP